MKKFISATIITIGDELLIGQVIDTNSAFIAQSLNRIGVKIDKKIAVGDDAAEINVALDAEINKTSVILITGGLGSTSDDVTKKALNNYFQSTLVTNKRALQHIRNLYKNVYKKPVSAVVSKQAEVPEACRVIINQRGSAPCMMFEKGHSIIFSLPGVPFEMEGLMPEITDEIQQRFQLAKIIHRTLITAGIPETELASLLSSFENKLSSRTRLAYLPGLGLLKLRLSSIVKNKMEEAQAKQQFALLKKIVTPYLIATDDTPIETTIGKLLLKKKKTVATAESCTGGYISSMITSVPGASEYFPGCVVSYSNDIKSKLLGVKKATLKKHGAVSQEVVTEMAKGILKKMGTDYGIAVSGIMGPGGGSMQKPVGTVWIAAGNREKIISEKVHFRFNRERNIKSTALRALYLLKRFIENSQ